MSSGTRLISATLRALPIIIIIGITILMLTGDKDPYRDLIADAEFTDVNEYGDLVVLTFVDSAPDPSRLAAIETVTRLSIQNSTITTDLAQVISSRKELRSLSLSGCTIDTAGLQTLDGHSNLRELDLSNTSDLSAAVLQLNIPNLTTLKLNGCSWVDDSFVVQLTEFSKLESLNVSRTSVTTAGIASLSILAEFQWLECRECRELNDEVFTALRQLPKLSSIRMSGDRLSVAAAKSFQQSNPQVRMFIPMGEFAELRPLLSKVRDGRHDDIILTTPLTRLQFDDNDGSDYSALRHFPELTSLTLSGRGITDDSVSFLANMTGLKQLNLTESAISDAGLQHVANLQNLTTLNLSATSVSDDGMKNLVSLPNLRWLDLSETRVSDAGLEQLQSLPLEYLDLRGIALSERGMRAIRRFQNLTGRLDLTASRFGQTDLTMLKGKSFRSVILAGQTLSREEFAVFATWSELTSLDLSDTRITGEHLDLSRNAQLRNLILDRTRVTDDTLVRMKLPASLSHLSLVGTSVLGESLSGIAGLNLRSLDLSSNSLTEKGVQKAFELQIPKLSLVNVFCKARIPALHPADGDSFELSVSANSPIYDCVVKSSFAKKLTSLILHNAKTTDLRSAARFRNLYTLRLVNSKIDAAGFQPFWEHRRIGGLTLIDCQLSAEAISEIGKIKQLDRLAVNCPQKEFSSFASLAPSNPRLDVERLDRENGTNSGD